MGYNVPEPPIQNLPREVQDVVRRLREQVTNLETVTNLQGFSGGRNAQAPPKARLIVANAPVSGIASVQVTNPEYLPTNRNRMRAPIKHWVLTSPFPDFSKDVTDHGISHQTHWALPLGKGTYYTRLYSTFDGVTFNNPIQQKVTVT